MSSDISYYFDIDRTATSFTLNADYYIAGFYDSWTGGYYTQTRWDFEYRNSQGGLIDSSGGFAGETASVEDTFLFDTTPGVKVNHLEFSAYNTYDGYGFYFTWNVYDGARETTGLTLNGTGDTDIMFGGSARDTLNGNGEADWLDGGGGIDLMRGGLGDDTYVVDVASDQVIEAAGAGFDTIRSSVSFTIRPNVETLDLIGNAAIDAVGNDASNILAGNDAANTLIGLGGADTLIGEGGADLFQFRSITDSTVALAGRDLIEDFSRVQGDHIGLAAIDANTQVAGNQAFSFIGNTAFTGQAGQLRTVYADGNTVVLGDVDGNGGADFAITVGGLIALNAGDFLL